MNDLRREFHADLDAVRDEIARLGASVIELIPRVTGILLQQDLEGAEYVLRADDEIDARAVAIEDSALRLLALQQPMAGDLRNLAAALKLAPEIERSADLCGNICKAARRIYGHALDPKLRGIIQAMSDQAQQEYKSVIEAYIANDEVAAAALPDMDELLNDLHRQLIEKIFEGHAAGTVDLQVAVQMAMVARFYERLGDHAVNISERVLYITTGSLPEQDPTVKQQERSAPATDTGDQGEH